MDTDLPLAMALQAASAGGAMLSAILLVLGLLVAAAGGLTAHSAVVARIGRTALRPEAARAAAATVVAAILAGVLLWLALRTLLPASMGGNPEQGKQHFELAIRYSEEKDLMAKVAYAERYARLVYDQQLHDRLLHEVLAADTEHPGLTLSNVLAQQQAALMMNDEYF